MLVGFDRAHEFIGHPDAVVRILEKDRGIGLAVNGAVVTRVDQRPGLGFLPGFAPDELDDIGMINV